ncbi:MAG: thermonuclease family protein [Anaerolineae bacterium]|nr:MAG: thermonuclease family protein [Anaerolineae bacterium]
MKRGMLAVALLTLALALVGCDLFQAGGETGESEERVRVSQVVDGDTVELANGRKVRYLGVNTPERGQPFYEEAKQFNAELVADKTVRLELDVDTIDQYGRTLAHVFVGDRHVNLELVRQGYANVYTVPPNVKYSEELLAAEREAREEGRGLWALSGAPIRITGLDPVDEWVEFTNQGDAPIDMSGYTLKDEANHIYEFGGFTLGPKWSARLYTGNGQNTDSELYWGMGNETVWNNAGDTAFLRDPEGSLVDVYTY